MLKFQFKLCVFKQHQLVDIVKLSAFFSWKDLIVLLRCSLEFTTFKADSNLDFFRRKLLWKKKTKFSVGQVNTMHAADEPEMKKHLTVDRLIQNKRTESLHSRPNLCASGHWLLINSSFL